MSWVKGPSGLGACLRIADSRRHEGGRKFRTAGVKVSRFAFSLSELLVAIGILGVGLLMLAAAFPVGIDQVRRAVELSTSEMVFNEAVNNLKTRVTPSELEAFFTATPTAELGTGTGIWLLDFDQLDTFNNPIFPNLDNMARVYSSANSYAWLAAVQRVGNAGSRCYRFWIFVVREPTGIINSAGTGLKVSFVSPITGFTLPSANIIKFNVGDPTPDRGQFLLGADGEIYKVTDVAANPTALTIKVDRDATGLDADTNGLGDGVTFITGELTRRAPTVAVYQTVVTY
jgi:type II secretory pathway pseudopilin PulG